MPSINRYTQYRPATYTPRTLQETLLAPQYMRQQHDNLINQYSAENDLLDNYSGLDIHASQLGAAKEALRQGLNEQVSQLDREGFSPNSRRNFIDYTNRFKREIGPNGTLGKIKAVKDTFDARKKELIEDAIKEGYSRSDAEFVIANQLQNYKNTYDGSSIENIPLDALPKYANLDEAIKEARGALGNDVVERMAQDGVRIANIVDGMPILVDRNGRVLEQSNNRQIYDAIQGLISRFTNPSSQEAKSLVAQRITPDQTIDRVINGLLPASTTRDTNLVKNNYQFLPEGYLKRLDEATSGDAVAYRVRELVDNIANSMSSKELDKSINKQRESIGELQTKLDQMRANGSDWKNSSEFNEYSNKVSAVRQLEGIKDEMTQYLSANNRLYADYKNQDSKNISSLASVFEDIANKAFEDGDNDKGNKYSNMVEALTNGARPSDKEIIKHSRINPNSAYRENEFKIGDIYYGDDPKAVAAAKKFFSEDKDTGEKMRKLESTYLKERKLPQKSYRLDRTKIKNDLFNRNTKDIADVIGSEGLAYNTYKLHSFVSADQDPKLYSNVDINDKLARKVFKSIQDNSSSVEGLEIFATNENNKPMVELTVKLQHDSDLGDEGSTFKARVELNDFSKDSNGFKNFNDNILTTFESIGGEQGKQLARDIREQAAYSDVVSGKRGDFSATENLKEAMPSLSSLLPNAEGINIARDINNGNYYLEFKQENGTPKDLTLTDILGSSNYRNIDIEKADLGSNIWGYINSSAKRYALQQYDGDINKVEEAYGNLGSPANMTKVIKDYYNANANKKLEFSDILNVIRTFY